MSSEPLIFEGRAARGRFGMSLLNLGDIDQDGYEGTCRWGWKERSGRTQKRNKCIFLKVI